MIRNIANEIDGSILEGGGQVIRNSVAISALMCKSLKLFNIRGGRPKPGLQAQHMCGLQLVHQMMSAGKTNKICVLEGCTLGSKEVTFKPFGENANDIDDNDEEAQDHEQFAIDIQTAGATTLLAQVALPVALFRPSKSVLMDLKGGTNAAFAPPIDYYEAIFGHILQRFFGASFDTKILKRGYFPKGGGHIQLNVKPLTRPLQAVTLTDPGNVSTITVYASCAGKVPRSKAKQMASSASQHLVSQGLRNDSIDIVTQYFDSNQAFGNGSHIFVKAELTSGCVLGSSAILGPKDTPEQVGKDAATAMLRYINQGVCLDEYAQDQVIIFMALAKGRSKVLIGPLTLHTKTAIYVLEHLTEARFKVNPVSEVTNIIECEGIGFEPNKKKKSVKQHP